MAYRLRFLLICLLILAQACSSPESRHPRVLVLAMDGLDPITLDLMMSEDKLPNFAKLRQGGAYGRLLSQKPLLSPVIWTTVATGKTPDLHGIGHFVALNEKTGEKLPVTSRMRKVKALWNIFSEAGRKVDVVGWWATWPPEQVNGAVVSDHTCYHFLFEDGFEDRDVGGGQIWPPELASEIVPMIRRPDSLTATELAPFVNVSPEELARAFSFEDDLSHFRWAFATAESYAGIGLHLWKTQAPDLMMTYIEATDSTAHLFGHLFRNKDLAGELAEQQKKFGGTVEAVYLYADRVLGRYLDALDSNTTLVVLSDHGFQLGQLPDDPSRLRDMRRVSEKYHRIEGILYLYGNQIKPLTLLNQPSILDVAPTLLALAGLPRAKDMPGRVLAEALISEPDKSAVATYETGARSAAAEEADSSVDPAIVEHLQSLGYLGSGSEPTSVPRESSPEGERNLAAINFEEGKFEEAAQAYKALIQKDPNDGALYASLAGALGALGRYDEALVAINEAIRLEPLNAEAYHNRAVIYERTNQPKSAIEEYRKALRYNSQYEPARQALVRLGAMDQVLPRTPEEKQALGILDQVSDLARRGDYPGALKKLDEAESMAPRLTQVYQYRSNIAFLMGNVPAAMEALRVGLELEPDNELFKANLKRLQALLSATPTP